MGYSPRGRKGLGMTERLALFRVQSGGVSTSHVLLHLLLKLTLKCRQYSYSHSTAGEIKALKDKAMDWDLSALPN